MALVMVVDGVSVMVFGVSAVGVVVLTGCPPSVIVPPVSLADAVNVPLLNDICVPFVSP